MAEMFQAYGGARCACCGETERTFLSIDHINNDGAAHRREAFGRKEVGGATLAQLLRKQGFPEGFQILCMNCNMGKARNGGICPHQRTR
jgi:hypothetical protein